MRVSFILDRKLDKMENDAVDVVQERESTRESEIAVAPCIRDLQPYFIRF